MLDALQADPLVAERFQFLTFGYAGGAPITHVSNFLRRDLRALRDRVDPQRTDAAWDRMVLVGHSMGGILCKMMTQSSGSKLWDLTTDRRIEELAGPADAREVLRAELVYEPLPDVRRVVFIATPHRGSQLVCKLVKDVEAYLVRRPKPLEHAYAQLLECNTPDAFTSAFRDGSTTCLDQLAWQHPLLLAIDGLPAARDVNRHSVIADQRRPPRPDGGDGFVEYASAHQRNVTSELLVNSGHFCLENPEAISEILRILKEHAIR
jgi:pimeloyl-ACP methyl ester carboxylesterase